MFINSYVQGVLSAGVFVNRKFYSGGFIQGFFFVLMEFCSQGFFCQDTGQIRLIKALYIIIMRDHVE